MVPAIAAKAPSAAAPPSWRSGCAAAGVRPMAVSAIDAAAATAIARVVLVNMVSLVMSRMLVETTLNLVARSGEARAKRIMFSQCRSTDVQECQAPRRDEN